MATESVSHRIKDPEPPNLQDVTAESLPLLATVLAGFSATGLVALLVEADLRERFQGTAGEFGLQAAVILLAVSIPVQLAATSCAVWGRAYDYRNLTPDVRKILKIEKADDKLELYLRRMHRRWQIWHRASLAGYYAGLALFFAGLATLIWVLVRPLAGGIFVGTVLILALVGWLLVFIAGKR